MALDGSNILLLQGPIGPFFAYFAEELQRAGATCFKINFNKGDRFFALADIITDYHGNAAEWRDYLSRYVRNHNIDSIIVYGDQRFYHRAAREIAQAHDIRFFAFEEGYVRPGYVTFEEFGNNANSHFAQWFNHTYEKGELDTATIPTPLNAGYTFGGQIWNAIAYYVVKDWKFFGFKAARHHRPGNWFTEMNAWILTWFRKQGTKRFERTFIEDLEHEKQHTGANVYFVPLQVAVDSQILYHSRFDGMKDFLSGVFQSFSQYAPKDAILVLKHHPMDRGYNHYGKYISKLAKQNGIAARVRYVFEVDLTRLLENTDACVTVNSTVGLIALKAGVPAIALGKAMFSDAGLTFDGKLDEFWQQYGEVNQDKLQKFEDFLRQETLVAGSFYGKRRQTSVKAIDKLKHLLSP